MFNTTHYRRLMLCVIVLTMMTTTGCPGQGKKGTPKKATKKPTIHTPEAPDSTVDQEEEEPGSGDGGGGRGGGGITGGGPRRPHTDPVEQKLQGLISKVDKSQASVLKQEIRAVSGSISEETAGKAALIFLAITRSGVEDGVWKLGGSKIRALGLPRVDIINHGATEGVLGLVRLSLLAGFSVDTKLRTRFTALYEAALKGHEPIVDLLLAEGADRYLLALRVRGASDAIKTAVKKTLEVYWQKKMEEAKEQYNTSAYSDSNKKIEHATKVALALVLTFQEYSTSSGRWGYAKEKFDEVGKEFEAMDLTKISDKQGFKNSLGRYVGRLGSLFAGKDPIVIEKKKEIIAKVNELIKWLSSEEKEPQSEPPKNSSEVKSEPKHQDESEKSPTGPSTALSLQIAARFPNLEEIDCTYSEKTMEEVKQSLDFLTVNQLEEEEKAQCYVHCEKYAQYVVSCPSCEQNKEETKWERNFCENCLKKRAEHCSYCAHIVGNYDCHAEMCSKDLLKLGLPVPNFFLRKGARKRLVDMGLMYKECSDADCPGALIKNVPFYKKYHYKCSCGKIYHVDGLKALEEAITNKAFPCPGCHAPTYRTGKECLHMTCSQCGASWCWTCHFHIKQLLLDPSTRIEKYDDRLNFNRNDEVYHRAHDERYHRLSLWRCALDKETCPCKD